MRMKQKEKYEALGFVESLIAIMISGIVVAVLMNISVIAMRDLVKLDIEDAQAHHARSAAVIVQNIANRERLKEEASLFDTLDDDQCYALLKSEEDENEYEINTQFITLGDREAYISEGVINDGVNDNEEDYFRVVCVIDNGRNKAEIDDRTNKMLIKVTIGFNKVEGAFTTASDIRDYEYFAIINL